MLYYIDYIHFSNIGGDNFSLSSEKMVRQLHCEGLLGFIGDRSVNILMTILLIKAHKVLRRKFLLCYHHIHM